ncbi:hypothetical protein HQ544_00025 [Candidatus Falkowbacteria bacterium]|nr:hypothetical protein [Candidatus Falkowbacteria bacterium]
MRKEIKQEQQAKVTIPLKAMRCLYGNPKEKKIVCEIDWSAIKSVNEPTTVDEMVMEGRMEYFAGELKGFESTRELMDDLNS